MLVKLESLKATLPRSGLELKDCQRLSLEGKLALKDYDLLFNKNENHERV